MPLIDWTAVSAGALAGALSGGAVTWLLKAWIQSRLDVSTQQRVAEFQARLEATSAAASYEYQRELQAYNHFVARKYEVVAELYRRILDAQSHITRLVRGIPDVPDIGSLPKPDAERYMVEHANVPEGLAAEIAASWDRREEAVSRFEAFLDQMRPEYARRAWAKANNYRLENELYLSDQAAESAREVTDILIRTFNEFYLQGGSNRRVRAAIEDLKPLVLRLKSLLQEDLLAQRARQGDMTLPEPGSS